MHRKCFNVMPLTIRLPGTNPQAGCTAFEGQLRQTLTFPCRSEDFRIAFEAGCKSLDKRRLVRDYIPASAAVFVVAPELPSTDAWVRTSLGHILESEVRPAVE